MSDKTTAGWWPIETAPRNEEEPLACCWEGRSGWEKLWWKTNPRTGRSYFGDVEEMDDYELADDQPTHWMRLPEPPGP